MAKKKKHTKPRPRPQPQSQPKVQPPTRPGHIAALSLLFMLVAVVALTAAANARNSIFKDKVTLWMNAVVRSPFKQRTHENLGFALSAAGQYERAIREFEKVLALKDGSVPMRDVYREIGVVYFRVGRLDDAIMAWQKGLTFAPMDPDLMTNISITYLRKRDYDAALPYALNANRINPLRAEPLNTLGEIFMVRGDYGRAVEYFLSALELDPDPPFRYWNAALAFEKAGRYESAFQYMSRFAAKVPDENARRDALLFLERVKRQADKQKMSER